MSKADVLDMLLSTSCCNPSTKHEGYHAFTFKGHCVGYTIHAKCVGDWDEKLDCAHFQVIDYEEFDC